MPIYLKEKDDFPELERFSSVLLVPCRFCPAASMAVTKGKPYFEFLRRFLKTGSYEQLLNSIKSKLRIRGIKTDIFRSRWPHQFVVCVWTSRRRKKLLRRARDYDAVVVMGCEAAVQIIYDTLETTHCKVYQGMRSEGIMTIKPSFRMPANISIELDKIIPLASSEAKNLPWAIL